MLALGAGRSPAARAAMEPLPAGSTLCQPRARREWGDTGRHTQTQMDRGMGCSACHPRDKGMGPRDGCHGTPARTTLESQTEMGCSPLGQHPSPGNTRVLPPLHPYSCCTPPSPLPTLGTSHGCRRERWGGTAQPGTHSSVSSQHPPSHISHPDAFQIPRDSPRPLSCVPWDPLQVLKGAGSTVGGLGTCQGCGQRGHPNPWHTLAPRPRTGDAPKLFKDPTPTLRPAGHVHSPDGQDGLSRPCGSQPERGKQQRDARGRRERQQPAGIGV